MKCLFSQEFGAILDQSKEDEIFSGVLFLKILKDMSLKADINLPQNLKTATEQSLLMKPIIASPAEIKENWSLIQRIIKSNGHNLDKIVNKVLMHGRSVEIHIFIYEFFNTYRKLKDLSNTMMTNGKSTTFQLEIHNQITNINQCAHLFEKLVFLLSQASGVKPLEVG